MRAKNKNKKIKKQITEDEFYKLISGLITESGFGNCNQERAYYAFAFLSHLIIEFDGMKAFNKFLIKIKKNKLNK